MRNWLLLSCCFTIFFNSGSFSMVKPPTAVIRRTHLSTGFLFQRTVSINQKACSCPTVFSCSCCQSVTILLRGVTRNLCVNFTYAQTGLSMTITLGSNMIRQVSIIDYRAFKVCTPIPDCRNSFACVEVVEVSLFPRSITICMQLDLMSKFENWLINYNCISLSTLLSNQTNTNTTTPGMPGGTVQPTQMTTGQMPTGPMTTGQMPTGQTPMGQMPSTQMPTGQTTMGQMPSTQMPMGQMPTGQMPTGQMPTGQMPTGQMPTGQMPTGQMPSGQMPTGQMPAVQMQTGQMPTGQMPTGQMPSGQMPTGQMPTVQMQTGQMPTGQMPTGQMPSGQMPTGQMPPGQMPSGQMPPGQFQLGQMPSSQIVSGRGRTPIFKSTRRVPGFLNWVSSRKSRAMQPAVRMIKNELNNRGFKAGRNSRAINILPINKMSKTVLQERGRVLRNRKGQRNHFYTAMKIECRDHFDSRKVISNDLPIRLNHRTKRNIPKLNNSAMKMQVILRSRKTRLPKIIGNDLTKNFKGSVFYPAYKSPEIVNQDTISIPMSDPGLGNVIILNTKLSNNGFTPLRNVSQTELAPPQQIPDSSFNGFSEPRPPFLVLENAPSIDGPIPFNFSVNYDNRTSSFPDRMPPSFGIASRIGPIDRNLWLQSFERSVEELETERPRIQLHANSKIIEMPTTDLSDGRMIFPE